jgi:predicted RNA binding protein YcfA (HicA-like mRNA interferase family)
VRTKHRDTLGAIFRDPSPATIAWSDAIALLKALGAEVSEGRGSRVRVSLNGVDAVLHRPHPGKEISRPMVRSIRRFLGEAGVRP